MKLPYPADDIAEDTARLIDAATEIVRDRGYDGQDGIHYLMVVTSTLLNSALSTTLFDHTERVSAPVLQLISEER